MTKNLQPDGTILDQHGNFVGIDQPAAAQTNLRRSEGQTMKTIEYRATYSGVLVPGKYGVTDEPAEETIRVNARDINSGFAKALERTREPLGNGYRRELIRLEFSQIP